MNMKKQSVFLFLCLFFNLILSGCSSWVNTTPPVTIGTNIPQSTLEATLQKTFEKPNATSLFQSALETPEPTLGQINPIKGNTPTNSPAVETIEKLQTPTIVNKKSEDVVYAQDFLNTSTYFYILIEDKTNQYKNPFIVGYPGPNSPGSSSLRFANFEDKIAYIDQQNIVWVSDLMNQNPIKVYTYPTEKKVTVYLTWTPNDQQLLLDATDSGFPNKIYDIKSGQISDWNYECNQLAFSPRSNELTPWCKSTSGASHFAVLEWGGNIWYTDKAPDKLFLISESPDPEDDFQFRLFSLYRNVGWSSDGHEIAFFDTRDKAGILRIVNRSGSDEKQVSQTAYWSNDVNKKMVNLPGVPIQWSKNGKRILILAAGTDQRPCPKLGPEFFSPETSQGCWHVIDSSSGELLWNAADIKTDEVRNGSHKDEEAVISTDGLFVALFSYILGPEPRCFVIELGAEKVYSFPYTIEIMRWGPRP